MGGCKKGLGGLPCGVCSLGVWGRVGLKSPPPPPSQPTPLRLPLVFATAAMHVYALVSNVLTLRWMSNPWFCFTCA